MIEANDRQCEAMSVDGQPCRATPMKNSPFCYQHSDDPSVAEHRDRSRRLGGLVATRQRVLQPDTPAPKLDNPTSVREVIEETIHQVRTGTLAPNVGNCVLYGIGIALKLAELELSADVARLERLLLKRRGG